MQPQDGPTASGQHTKYTARAPEKSQIEPCLPHSSTYWNQLLFDVADLRQLTMQNILVTQSKAKADEEASAKVYDAQRVCVELRSQNQHLVMNVRSVEKDLEMRDVQLESERHMRQSLEDSFRERGAQIVDLRQQLAAFQDENRDLRLSNVKLSNALCDLTGVHDTTATMGRLNVQHGERDSNSTRMRSHIVSLLNEKRELEDEIAAWRERYASLCAETNNQILERDELIHTLQSSLCSYDMLPPA